MGMRHDAIEIGGDSTYIFVDGPFVVVQDDDKFLGVMSDVVERLVSNAASKRGIPCQATTCSSVPR